LEFRNVDELQKLFDEYREIFIEMEEEGLIPEEGDSEYLFPAMFLRAGRLVYERLNNGNINYVMEDEDGFYHRLEKELNMFGYMVGFENLGSVLIDGSEEEAIKGLRFIIDFILENKSDLGLHLKRQQRFYKSIKLKSFLL
jgi:hypothetical protein